MIIKIGSKGKEVEAIQQKLGLTADGSFGPNTEKAVKEWQTKNGLTADGIVGPATLEKMGIKPVLAEDVVIPKSTGPMDLSKLKGHVPDTVITQIPGVMEKFEINTPLRLSHFLAQCGHESAGFKAVSENLNYSADGLMKIFPRYFPNKPLAEQYARQPEKIASKVYGARMGNGAEDTKEGFKFRGRGYIQLTGKDNYTAFDKFVDDDILGNPDLVSTKYPLMSAGWFFYKNCLKKCDLGADDAAVIAVTKCVNGGTIGLEDRKKHFKEYYSLLA